MAECLIKRRYNDGSVKIVSWQNGTAAELAAMLAAHDEGLINIYNYWSIGDERTIHHSAMNASYVSESHAAQDVAWVLMDTGAQSGYNFVDGSPVHYVVGMKNCFNEKGYIDSRASQGTITWGDSQRRQWCNSILLNSFDADTRALFKKFYAIYATGSSIRSEQDYFSLFAEKNVFGSNINGHAQEANSLSWIEYYKTSANRIKKVNNTDATWMLRSLGSANNIVYCSVTNIGNSSTINASNPYWGISAFGCI